MEECVRLTQQKLRGAPTVKKRAKTVYSQRNLGTIRERKKEKKQDSQQGNGDMILRILRMRYAAPVLTQPVLSLCLFTLVPEPPTSSNSRSRLRNQHRQNMRNGLLPVNQMAVLVCQSRLRPRRCHHYQAETPENHPFHGCHSAFS